MCRVTWLLYHEALISRGHVQDTYAGNWLEPAEAVRHASALAPHLENSELAQQLVSATDAFDFERALALLGSIPKENQEQGDE